MFTCPPAGALRRILKSIQNIRWKTWNSSSLSEFNIHNTRLSIFDKDPVAWIISNSKVSDQTDILNSTSVYNLYYALYFSANLYFLFIIY